MGLAGATGGGAKGGGGLNEGGGGDLTERNPAGNPVFFWSAILLWNVQLMRLVMILSLFHVTHFVGSTPCERLLCF